MRNTTEGERRKLDAHAILEARRRRYILYGRRALLEALLRQGTATADDVRETVEVPPGVDPVCLGAVPGTLARAGIIRRVGFTKTTRVIGHARPVTVWALIDRAAALVWLADHLHKLDTHTPEADAGNSLFTEPTTNEKADAGTPAQLRKDSNNVN